MGTWGRGPNPAPHQTVTPPPSHHRLETLSMRLTALLVRLLVRLGLLPETQGLSEFLET